MTQLTAENPLGLDGFEFAEFTSPDPQGMRMLIERLGFTAYSMHPSKNVTRYKQGRINLLINSERFGQAQKYFDIQGQATGLFSQAMIAPDKAIRIPLNESQDDKSRIEEFIREYKGEGIQHLAFTTPDTTSPSKRCELAASTADWAACLNSRAAASAQFNCLVERPGHSCRMVT